MHSKNQLDGLIQTYLTNGFLDDASEQITKILSEDKKIITIKGHIVDLHSCFSMHTLPALQKKIF